MSYGAHPSFAQNLMLVSEGIAHHPAKLHTDVGASLKNDVR